ncbi:DUF2169 domain-containing protein [Bartonella sp. HY406]|uniref:DUF2169 family type VI secretion system accessory protein n=1 Tax=Bartonella sp. HY406 TaxID=2979331 RepID=UPI0021C8176B|nr:DUF2169 domain-containing protein [Bartonella sp. HY406]UXN02960.1 DUF2169 domain-containing protein [Bartonella sp. HY406]
MELQVVNNLPVSAFKFNQLDFHGKEYTTIVVKGQLKVDFNQKLYFVKEVPDFVFSDIFLPNSDMQELLYESDLAPFKPKTDFIINAVARSPENKMLKNWPVKFGIDNCLSYGFHVQGKRQFEPKGSSSNFDWQLSDAEPFSKLPILYQYAFGGTVKTSNEDVTSYSYNPIGQGLVSHYVLTQKEPISVPQIGSIVELNNFKIGKNITIHGCGPITKSWLPRIACAGALNDAWLRERYPLMPENFDFNYWNAAPLPLQSASYLNGDETITMNGLFHDPRSYNLQLPNKKISARIKRRGKKDNEEILLNLDTIHCDVQSENIEEHLITLLWRIVVDDPDTIEHILVHSGNSTLSNQLNKKPKDNKNSQEDYEDYIEKLQNRRSLLQKANLTLQDFEVLVNQPAIGTVSGIVAAKLYLHPQTQNPILISDTSQEILHIGKKDYLYNITSPVEHTFGQSVAKKELSRKINDPTIIYVRLLDEPIDVWRPVNALWHGNDTYFIHMQQAVHTDENWEFKPNEKVICKYQTFLNGECLIAVERDNSHW